MMIVVRGIGTSDVVLVHSPTVAEVADHPGIKFPDSTCR